MLFYDIILWVYVSSPVPYSPHHLPSCFGDEALLLTGKASINRLSIFYLRERWRELQIILSYSGPRLDSQHLGG